jgi:hypothetical protein
MDENHIYIGKFYVDKDKESYVWEVVSLTKDQIVNYRSYVLQSGEAFLGENKSSLSDFARWSGREANVGEVARLQRDDKDVASKLMKTVSAKKQIATLSDDVLTGEVIKRGASAIEKVIAKATDKQITDEFNRRKLH